MIGGDATGTVLFKRNSNWGKHTIDGTDAYWLRIDPGRRPGDFTGDG